MVSSTRKKVYPLVGETFFACSWQATNVFSGGPFRSHERVEGHETVYFTHKKANPNGLGLFVCRSSGSRSRALPRGSWQITRRPREIRLLFPFRLFILGYTVKIK